MLKLLAAALLLTLAASSPVLAAKKAAKTRTIMVKKPIENAPILDRIQEFIRQMNPKTKITARRAIRHGVLFLIVTLPLLIFLSALNLDPKWNAKLSDFLPAFGVLGYTVMMLAEAAIPMTHIMIIALIGEFALWTALSFVATLLARTVRRRAAKKAARAAKA